MNTLYFLIKSVKVALEPFSTFSNIFVAFMQIRAIPDIIYQNWKLGESQHSGSGMLRSNPDSSERFPLVIWPSRSSHEDKLDSYCFRRKYLSL